MGFIAYIIVGLISGTVAKAILSDRAVGGWVASLVIGLVGAVVGGWLGNLIFDIGLGTLTDWRTWVLSIVGAVIVLFIYTAVAGRRSAK